MTATAPSSLIPDGLTLPATNGLTALQEHMQRLCAHFDWQKDIERKFLLMTEEVGELARAIRRMERIQVEAHKAADYAENRANLEEELADVFGYLLDIANGYGIDLGTAYAKKMTMNFQRKWK